MRYARVVLLVLLAVAVVVLRDTAPGDVSADPALPLLRMPICGDQDGSESPLILNCAEFSVLTDVQTFRVPGTGAADLTFDFVFREASYNNEFGFFRVDNAAGQINGLNPGDPGYVVPLDRVVVVFPSGSTAFTPDVTKRVNGGDILAFFIIQNSTLANHLANNPTNSLAGSPLAFFSLDVLNPDNFDHFVGFRNLTAGLTQVGFEDLTGGGDKDYDDVVFNISPAFAPGVPLYKQCDPNWSGSYNHTSATICGLGCALTSVVMILRHYGVDTDPNRLNDWLNANGGYDRDGHIRWWTIPNYAKSLGIDLRYQAVESKVSRDLKVQRLNELVDAGIPVIVGVPYCGKLGCENPGHFVVVTGRQGGTWSVNDPGGHGGQTLDAYNVDAQLMSADPPPTSLRWYVPGGQQSRAQMLIQAHSPIELLVTDPVGRRTGYDAATGLIINEIPGASYGLDQALVDQETGATLPGVLTLYLDLPSTGSYRLDIVAVAAGSYAVDINAYDETGQLSSRLDLEGVATPGPSQIYEVSYSSVTGSNVEVACLDPPNGDSDGDGLTNESEVSFGTDGCDADTDGDASVDGFEVACGTDPLDAVGIPERIDGAYAGVDDDGDTLVDELLPSGADVYDCDGDGWTGEDELDIYNLCTLPCTGFDTHDQDPCGNDGWPADLDPNNTLNIGDFNGFVFPLRPDGSFNKFGHPVPDADDPATGRWNLFADGIINIGDLNAINPAVLAPTARPPMFGGQPAFFGTCPWPP
ncbi:MAG: C39 family peptidase [Dehalococcoidia bacterium]|nr:C39 family peptidase [Dehalococcoidia bacterium]